MMDNAATHNASVYAGGGSFGNESYLRNNFTLREGTYRNVFEYAKTSHGQTQVANIHPVSGMPVTINHSSIPVRISVASVKQTTPEERFPVRLVFNVGREIYVHVCKSIWAPPELNRPLDKQLYKGPPTCHELNPRTASLSSLNLLIGFASGCVIHSDPLRRDITRLFNEDRIVDNTKVTCVRWLPAASADDNLFMAAHASGNVFVYNSQLPWVSTVPPYSELRRGAGYTVHACKAAATRNPTYKWTLESGINDMAFSPCGKYLAFARRDGVLQVFEWAVYELIGASRSYFGGLLCCAWSHDSRFVAAAGEDDLVHVWSLEHCRVIARCRGHRSWVSRVAWDPCNSFTNDDFSVDDGPTGGGGDAEMLRKTRNRLNSYSTARQISAEDYAGLSSSSLALPAAVPARMVYRFASVGQDTQLCVWELTEDVINQVLFPSKARNSFVIPANSELLRRGGRRFAFRATAGGTKTASGDSGSSSLASSTRSSAVAANTDVVAAAASAAAAAGSEPTPPLLIQSGRRFRFPLNFMRRSSPGGRNSKSTGNKVIDAEVKINADSTRENDSSSTLQGVDASQKPNEVNTSFSHPLTDITNFGNELKTPRGVSPSADTPRSTSAYERRRQSARAAGMATASTDNDDDDETDGGARSDGDGLLQLMSDGEILERHSHTGGSANKHRGTTKGRVGGALSVDSNIASLSLPTHGKADAGKKKKRRQFTLMRFGRSNAAVAAEGDNKKLEVASTAAEASGSESSRHVGRRVAASLFGTSSATSSSSTTTTTTTTTTTDMLGGFAAALAVHNKNRFLTPECPRLDDVPMLEPVMCKSVSTERLTDIVFLDECMLIATQDGTVQVWGRPEFLLIAQQQSNHDRRLDSISSRAAAMKAGHSGAGKSGNSSSRTSSYGSDKDYRRSGNASTAGVSGSQVAGSTTRSANLPSTLSKSVGDQKVLPNSASRAKHADGAMLDEDNDDLVEAARYGQTSDYHITSRFPHAETNNTFLSNGLESSHVDADDDDELIDLDAAGNRTTRSRNGRSRPSENRTSKNNPPAEFMATNANHKPTSSNNNNSKSNVAAASSQISVRQKKTVAEETFMFGSNSSRDSQSTLVNSYNGDGDVIDDRDINGEEKFAVVNGMKPGKSPQTKSISASNATKVIPKAMSHTSSVANGLTTKTTAGGAASDLGEMSTSNYSIRFAVGKGSSSVRTATAEAASSPGLDAANAAAPETLRRVK